MNFHIITLFPNSFDSYLGESIVKRAIEDTKITVAFYNPRDFADNAYKRIDQKPYAGGPGMVIQAEPVIKAVEDVLKRIAKRDMRSTSMKNSKGTKTRNSKFMSRTSILFFSPSGKQFDTAYAKKNVKKYTDVIMICGRYEGIDERVKKVFKMEDLSVGPFVLTGGELPAMLVLDCMARQVEGVLGNFNSLEESRVASSAVYTRPEVFEYNGKKYRVPKVLLSGDHKKIEEWREKHK